MKTIQRIFLQIIRIGAGLVAASVLFSILPLVNIMFRSDTTDNMKTVIKQVSLARVVHEEKKKEQVPKHKLRKLSIPSRQNSVRNMFSKFTPDLSIGGVGDGAVVATRQNLENIVFEEGQTDEPPVILFSTPPKYPYKARNQGIEGVVLIVILIDRNGRPLRVSFESLPHEIFRKPVEEAVAKWRFRPAYHKGMPVRIRVRQEFEFGVNR